MTSGAAAFHRSIHARQSFDGSGFACEVGNHVDLSAQRQSFPLELHCLLPRRRQERLFSYVENCLVGRSSRRQCTCVYVWIRELPSERDADASYIHEPATM